MPNAFAMIDEALWRRDKDFRQLPRGAQCTFVQLLSQRDVDTAGVCTLHVDIIAKGCDELTAEQVWDDLRALEAAAFVYVDEDTDELLIRSYLRRISARSPNALKSAYKAVHKVSSPKLRSVLAAELRRIGSAVAVATADAIDAGWTPSERDSDPVGIPSGWGIPSGRGSDPPSSSSVLALVSPSVVVTGGGASGEPSQSPTDSVDSRSGADAPPPPDLTDSGKTQNDSGPVCAKHPGGPDHDEPCVACGRVRKYRDALGAVNGVKQPQAVTEAEQRRIQRDREDHERRMAIRRCPDCDSEGNLDWRANGGTVFPCPHDSRLYREVHDAYVADMQERHASWEAWSARQQQENQERIAALAEIGREASHG